MEIVLSKKQKKKSKKKQRQQEGQQQDTKQKKHQEEPNRETTVPETLTAVESTTREEYTDIDKLADVSLGENQILFSNFNHDTSQASIKNFLETQGIKGTPIEFFIENYRLRRAVLVKVRDLKATVTYTYLCEEKEYELSLIHI